MSRVAAGLSTDLYANDFLINYFLNFPFKCRQGIGGLQHCSASSTQLPDLLQIRTSRISNFGAKRTNDEIISYEFHVCVCVRGPEGNISLTEVTVCHRDTMSQQRHMGEACVIIWNMIDEDERRLTDDLSCISTQHYGCTNSKSALVLPSRPNDATLIDDVLCFSCKHRREPQPQFDLSFFFKLSCFDVGITRREDTSTLEKHVNIHD